jgi:Spy/CpxP family protein refolding chaperone
MIMATTFHTIDKDIYGQEDFHKNYKSAQREGLTDQQSQKLSDVLYPQKQSLDHNEQPTKEDLPELVEDIVVDGDVLEIWDKISEEERLDMESGVTHLVSQ